MTNNIQNELPHTDLVDPATEAFEFLPLSTKYHAWKTISTLPDDGNNLVALLSRSNRRASWGFLTYRDSFPLRVGDITCDTAAKLRTGDEIFAINKLVPESYEEAMQLFQRPRLHLELYLRRVGKRHSCPNGTNDHIALSPNVTLPEELHRSMTSCHSSAHSNSVEMTSPSSYTLTDFMSRGGVRPSAQMALDNVLRVEQARGGGTSDVADRHVLFPVEASNLEIDKNFSEKVWQRIVSRKRARTFSEEDDCKHADLCNILPKPARQAIYDRSNCPFSGEKHFTAEFHNAVQYILTQKALLYGRDANTRDPSATTIVSTSSNANTAVNDRSCFHRDPEVLKEIIESKVSRRDEEVKRHCTENGFVERKEELIAVHDAMLRVVSLYRTMREEQRRSEMEKYRQMERAAQEFLATYIKASSLNTKMAGNNQQKLQQHCSYMNNMHFRTYEPPLPPFTSSHSQGDNSVPPPVFTTSTEKVCLSGVNSSRLMRLPTPPPPNA